MVIVFRYSPCVHHHSVYPLGSLCVFKLGWIKYNPSPVRGNTLTAVWTVCSGTLDEPCWQEK